MTPEANAAPGNGQPGLPPTPGSGTPKETGKPATPTANAPASSPDISAMQKSIDTLTQQFSSYKSETDGRLQAKDEVIGRLQDEVGSSRSRERNTEQMKTVGQNILEALGDTEHPERIAELFSNHADFAVALVQEGETKRLQNFNAARKQHPDINYQDVLQHAVSRGMRFDELTSGKAFDRVVAEIVTANKVQSFDPIKIAADARAEGEANLLAKLKAMGATIPSQNGNEQHEAPPKSETDEFAERELKRRGLLH